ncbi:hypothetical protein Neosp_012147 [[Neocosmospora] mangrovei]
MSSEVPTLIGVSSMLLALVTIFVTIRFFVRSFLLRSLDWDDGSYVDTVPEDHLRKFLKARNSMARYVSVDAG